MKEEKTTPLRERMIEDMRIRGIKETTQKGHIRAVKNFAAFLGRPPDTATPDELRAFLEGVSIVGADLVEVSPPI